MKKLETDNFQKIPPVHEHQFTISVEWEEQTSPAWSSRFNSSSVIKVVTKLRCPCGEEIER